MEQNLENLTEAEKIAKKLEEKFVSYNYEERMFRLGYKEVFDTILQANRFLKEGIALGELDNISSIRGFLNEIGLLEEDPTGIKFIKSTERKINVVKKNIRVCTLVLGMSEPELRYYIRGLEKALSDYLFAYFTSKNLYYIGIVGF